MYDRVLEYIFYRMHMYLVNAFLHLRGCSTTNFILHVVLYHVKPLNKYMHVTKN